ncbi:MerR family transcriptional regulator [Massilia sp. S19_KUP03_FR1]|uniref:MerR family transcriptional regulator n=1 Tax=Massilia sp. S19_KUP03_FR1 TaxID=3025503 RepID=UPI002FCD1CC9
MSNPAQKPASHTISDVERDIGVAKETLRVWERRYGFPQPERDFNDERTYPLEQVERLARIKRLIDHGHRPGKLMALSDAELAELGAKVIALAPAVLSDPELAACMALLRRHQGFALRAYLSQSLLRRGLRDFVVGLLVPLSAAVRHGWADGSVTTFEERIFAETLQHVLRPAILVASSRDDERSTRPRVLLTTVPQERSSVGLLMSESLLALAGAHCISLGPQTALADIVTAAQALRSDIVALSFSSRVATRVVADSVAELRNRFDGKVAVWASGSGAVLARRLLADHHFIALEDIGTAIARWHGTPRRD